MNGCFSCSWQLAPSFFVQFSVERSCDEDGLKFLKPRMEGFRSQEESFCGASAAPNGLNEINYFPMTHHDTPTSLCIFPMFVG